MRHLTAGMIVCWGSHDHLLRPTWSVCWGRHASFGLYCLFNSLEPYDSRHDPLVQSSVRHSDCHFNSHAQFDIGPDLFVWGILESIEPSFEPSCFIWQQPNPVSQGRHASIARHLNRQTCSVLKFLRTSSLIWQTPLPGHVWGLDNGHPTKWTLESALLREKWAWSIIVSKIWRIL